MTRTTVPTATACTTATTTGTTGAPARVSLPRRTAVVVTGLLASALPLVWGIGAVGMLATGHEADHRFHQMTGQGVLLAVLWLGGLLPLVRAGLRGRRPATAAALHHLSFVLAAGVAAVLSPGAGAAPVAVITAVTGALLWAALPVRPRVRGAFAGGLDLALAPVALLTAALVTPFALGQVELQRAMGDEHAEMAHYFDMAWVVFALLGLAACAALSASARSLSVWASAGLLVTGASRIVFTPDVTWSVLAMALGAAGLALTAVRVTPGRTAA